MPLTLILMGLLQTASPDSAAWQERHFPDVPKVPVCTFVSPAKEIGSLAELPEQVRTEVTRFFKAGGGLADANSEFNSTDVVDDRAVPQRRFIRAYLTDDIWFIWWEAGGIVHSLYTLALTRQRQEGGNSPVFRAAPGSVFIGNLCAGSRAFLTGVRAAGF